MKIQAHTSFIGTTGYANHAQSFFTELRIEGLVINIVIARGCSETV